VEEAPVQSPPPVTCLDFACLGGKKKKKALPRPIKTQLNPRKGLHVVHLCGGLGTCGRACVTAKVKLDKFSHCDIDPIANQTAAELLLRLHASDPEYITKKATRAFEDLPADIYDITEEVVKSYVATHGSPHLLMADFPCQDVSRAGEQKGVRGGRRSSLIFHIANIIRWFKLYGDTKFLVENVYFREHLPEDHFIVSRLLGVNSLDFDAALVSPSHRLRSYWTDIPGAVAPSERLSDLEDVLELEHTPNVAVFNDFPPFAIYNTSGEIRRKAATLVAAGENTYSYRDGSALVLNTFTGLLERPYIEEKERMVGLQPGDTNCTIASIDDRHRMVGNIFDANVMAHFITTLATHLDDLLDAATATQELCAQPAITVEAPRARRQNRKTVKQLKKAKPKKRKPRNSELFIGKNAYYIRAADDMYERQPWLDSHVPSTSADKAERPSDIKAYLVQRRNIYINCPVPKVPFRNNHAIMLNRFHIAKRTIRNVKRKIIKVQRLDGLPTALHWVVPPAADAPSWQQELHRALHQPTSLDNSNDVFSPGARLDVDSLRKLGFEPALCDELENGERYQLERQPKPFERNNYGS
jgi:hypothetical protein